MNSDVFLLTSISASFPSRNTFTYPNRFSLSLWSATDSMDFHSWKLSSNRLHMIYTFTFNLFCSFLVFLKSQRNRFLLFMTNFEITYVFGLRCACRNCSKECYTDKVIENSRASLIFSWSMSSHKVCVHNVSLFVFRYETIL